MLLRASSRVLARAPLARAFSAPASAQLPQELRLSKFPADAADSNSSSSGFDPNSVDGRTIGQDKDGVPNYAIFNEDLKAVVPEGSVALPRPGDKQGTFDLEIAGADDAAAIERYEAEMFLRRKDYADPTSDETYLEQIGFKGAHKAKLLGLLGLVAVSKEWYIINDETLVAAGLLGGFLTIFGLAKPEFMTMYNDAKKNFFEKQRGAEEKHIKACETFIDLAKSGAGISADVTAAISDQKDLVHAEAKAKAVKERLAVREDFNRRLLAMVNIKSEEQSRQFQELMEEAQAYAQSEAVSAKSKKAFMKYAIAAVAEPTKAGGSPANKIYLDFFNKKFSA